MSRDNGIEHFWSSSVGLHENDLAVTNFVIFA